MQRQLNFRQSFINTINTQLYRDIGEPQSRWLKQSAAIFRVKWPRLQSPITLKMSKSMVYIINKLGGDFQQGGCLYKSTNGIQWTSEQSWLSDRPHKQASEKQTCQFLAVVLWQLASLLMELLIDDETRSLPLCAYVGFFINLVTKYVWPHETSWEQHSKRFNIASIPVACWQLYICSYTG